MELDLVTFTPAQAAEISGVNVTLQRDWRRRGFLARQTGHARFDVFEVAELMALNTAAKWGIGPQQFGAISKQCAAGIVCWALQELRAWSGNPEQLIEANAYGVLDWDLTSNEIAARVLSEHGYDQYQGRFLVWWPDGRHGFEPSLDEAFSVYEDGDRRRVGAVVLDIANLGEHLVELARRPLCHAATAPSPLEACA